MTTAEIALMVSGLALLVAVASLWVNSLSPFRLRLSHDAPTFRLYKITPNISGTKTGETWWLPSFDMGISFYNTGRIPGEVLDIRLVADLKGHRTNRKFVFYPKWIVDYTKFQQAGSDRFTWIASAILRDWYPFMLGSQDEKDLHVILEGDRWDHKEAGELKLVLEVISSKTRQWQQCATYDLHISDDMFESKSSYTAFDENIEKLRQLEA